MEAVEVDRMRVRVPVLEYYPQQITLPGAQRGPRHLPVVGPRWVHHPWSHLDLHSLCGQLVLSNRPAALGSLLTPVELPQELRGVELREVPVCCTLAGLRPPEIILALSNITTNRGYMSKYTRLIKLFEWPIL